MSEERKPTGVLTYMDGHNRQVEREVNYTLDVRDFKGLAGEAHLIMAANPRLSSWDIWHLYRHAGIERPITWIEKRRWLYRPSSATGPVPCADRRDAQAFKIIRANPHISARDLVKLLRERGIERSRWWVQRWRVTIMDADPG